MPVTNQASSLASHMKAALTSSGWTISPRTLSGPDYSAISAIASSSPRRLLGGATLALFTRKSMRPNSRGSS